MSVQTAPDPGAAGELLAPAAATGWTALDSAGTVSESSTNGVAERARLTAMPGLDGLRGLAVAAVVLYHAGFEWMVGGFLGVSTFFTLSGFLITGLLMKELDSTGKISLRGFWTRRFRRLLPATLFTLAAVTVVFGFIIGTADQRAALRGDVLSSLFDVANWHFIFSGTTYGNLFSAPSPVLHFWSLAIEEQFYLVFPLLLLGLWQLAGRDRRLLAATLVALAVTSAVLPMVMGMSADRAYFGTDARAAELLLGAVLAMVVFSSGVQARLRTDRRLQRGIAVAALGMAAVQVYWWWTLPQPTEWLYRGGFALYALMTCVIIVAATLPKGVFVSALSWKPLRWLGTRSFAVYLLHWPVYLAVRQVAPDWSRAAQTALVITVSLAIAEVSFRLLERPIRQGRWPSPGSARKVAVAGVVVVAGLALLPFRVDESAKTTDFSSALDAFNSQGSALSSAALPPTGTSPVAAEPLAQPAAPAGSTEPPTDAAAPVAVPTPPSQARVATYGDSTGMLMALGLGPYQSAYPSPLATSGGEVQLGCGVSRFERRLVEYDEFIEERCKAWPTLWPQSAAALKPDIAMLVTGAWEVPDVVVPGTNTYSALGDPAVNAFVRSEIATAVDLLASQGSMVLLVLYPSYGSWADDGKPDAIARQTDPARMAVLHQILRDIAAERPATTRVYDFAGSLGPEVLADPAIRPDGLHIPETVMTDLYTRGIAQQIKDIWDEWWVAKQTGQI